MVLAIGLSSDDAMWCVEENVERPLAKAGWRPWDAAAGGDGRRVTARSSPPPLC